MLRKQSQSRTLDREPFEATDRKARLMAENEQLDQRRRELEHASRARADIGWGSSEDPALYPFPDRTRAPSADQPIRHSKSTHHGLPLDDTIPLKGIDCSCSSLRLSPLYVMYALCCCLVNLDAVPDAPRARASSARSRSTSRQSTGPSSGSNAKSAVGAAYLTKPFALNSEQVLQSSLDRCRPRIQCSDVCHLLTVSKRCVQQNFAVYKQWEKMWSELGGPIMSHTARPSTAAAAPSSSSLAAAAAAAAASAASSSGRSSKRSHRYRTADFSLPQVSTPACVIDYASIRSSLSVLSCHIKNIIAVITPTPLTILFDSISSPRLPTQPLMPHVPMRCRRAAPRPAAAGPLQRLQVVDRHHHTPDELPLLQDSLLQRFLCRVTIVERTLPNHTRMPPQELSQLELDQMLSITTRILVQGTRRHSMLRHTTTDRRAQLVTDHQAHCRDHRQLPI